MRMRVRLIGAIFGVLALASTDSRAAECRKILTVIDDLKSFFNSDLIDLNLTINPELLKPPVIKPQTQIDLGQRNKDALSLVYGDSHALLVDKENLLIQSFDLKTGETHADLKISPEDVRRLQNAATSRGAVYFIDDNQGKDQRKWGAYYDTNADYAVVMISLNPEAKQVQMARSRREFGRYRQEFAAANGSVVLEYFTYSNDVAGTHAYPAAGKMKMPESVYNSYYAQVYKTGNQIQLLQDERHDIVATYVKKSDSSELLLLTPGWERRIDLGYIYREALEVPVPGHFWYEQGLVLFQTGNYTYLEAPEGNRWRLPRGLSSVGIAYDLQLTPQYVVALDTSGELLKVRTAPGSNVEKIKIKEPVSTMDKSGKVIVSGSLASVVFPDRLVVVDLETNRVIWNSTDHHVFKSAQFEAAHFAHGGLVVQVFKEDAPYLLKLDPSTGTILWGAHLPTHPESKFKVYIGRNKAVIFNSKTEAYLMDLSTGHLVGRIQHIAESSLLEPHIRSNHFIYLQEPVGPGGSGNSIGSIASIEL